MDETRGMRIRRARKVRNLTQQELADAVEASVRTISDLEADKRSTHPGIVAAVMTYLELEGVPEETVGDFSPASRALGYMVMAYLDTLSESEREQWGAEFVRSITNSGGGA